MSRKKQNKHKQSSSKQAVKNIVAKPPTLTANASPVVATNAPPAIVTSTSGEKEFTWPKSFSEWITFCFKRWWALCVLVSTIIFTNIVTKIQGNPSQLWNFLEEHWLFSLGMVLLTAISPFVALNKTDAHKKASPQNVAGSHLSERIHSALDERARLFSHMLSHTFIPIILPIVTTTLFLSLLLLVLSRPAWCPGFICPPIQTILGTQPGGVHDQNLDAYFLSQESTSFELPGSLQQYTLQNLPRNIAAIRSDDEQLSPYRLVIGVHNLHQQGYEVYIDTVAVIVHAVPPLANPLNVWSINSLAYTTNPYSVTYAGEPAGSVLNAIYEPIPSLTGVHQRLQPRETDDIDLQINAKPHLQADLQFQVRITYRMANEGQEHMLTLPNLFEVVFSDVNNWHVYHF